MAAERSVRQRWRMRCARLLLAAEVFRRPAEELTIAAAAQQGAAVVADVAAQSRATTAPIIR
eukprot:1113-Heterococcus_DN1.PRE.1